MSQENVELARQLWEAFERDDVDWIVERCTIDFVFIQPRELPDARTYTGPKALPDALAGFPLEWDDFSVELLEIADLGGETVLSVCRNRGTGRTSGAAVDTVVFYLQRIRGSKIARMELFLERSHALEAAGLEE